MKYIPILIIALMIATIFPCVGAENVTEYYKNVTYPQEYYDATAWADSITESWHNHNENWLVMPANDPHNAMNYRLIAIQIALEKQNELISEQNELLRKLMNQTYTGKPMDSNGKLVIGGGYYSYIQPNN